MEILDPISEFEMVADFARGEISSGAFGPDARGYLASLGYSHAEIEGIAHRSDPADHPLLVHLSSTFRGYARREGIFTRFPFDTGWFRARLDRKEIAGLRYINCAPWVELSRGTRLVSDGARHLPEHPPTFERIALILRAIAEGAWPPPLILVGTEEDAELVILEGNARATAYARAPELVPEQIEVIVGFSPRMSRWRWF